MKRNVFRSLLAIASISVMCVTAFASEWQPWHALEDRVENGIDFRIKWTGDSGDVPGDHMYYYQFRSRYTQKMKFHYVITETHPDGHTTKTGEGETVSLAPNEESGAIYSYAK